jgi:hypothetical protein
MHWKANKEILLQIHETDEMTSLHPNGSCALSCATIEPIPNLITRLRHVRVWSRCRFLCKQGAKSKMAAGEWGAPADFYPHFRTHF